MEKIQDFYFAYDYDPKKRPQAGCTGLSGNGM